MPADSDRTADPGGRDALDGAEARALGRAWGDETPWNVLTALAELDDRMTGHVGEQRAAEIAADALEDAGARGVRTESFDLPVWTRGDCSLTLTERADEQREAAERRAVTAGNREHEREFDALALPYAPAGEATGRLVDVGYGTEAAFEDVDVSGRVVLASTDSPPEGRLVHRMEKYGRAVDRDATGFVFYNHKDGQLPPTGALRFGREAEIPAVGVSKEAGAWLREYADEDATVSLTVDATTEPGTGWNTHARLGPDTDEEVVVVAHHDAHDIAEGALDNGCGIAVVAGAAQLLAAMDLDCRVRVAGVGCEEVGLMGADALADSLDLDTVRAVVNVDGAGRFRNLRAYPHGSGTIEDMVEETCEEWGQPVSFSRDPHPYSDHWPFLQRGVPALQLHSERARRAGGARGRGWGHTHADTRDKVDPRNLREHAMLAALLVRELTRTEIPRIGADDLREQLRETDAESGMRAAEVWPDHWD